MSSLPKKIKIGCYTFNVLVEQEPKSAKGQDLYGEFNPEKQTIRLMKGMTKEREPEIVLHEVLHGIWNEYDLPTKNEEVIVRAMSRGLTQVLKDNPKLRTYWLKGIK